MSREIPIECMYYNFDGEEGFYCSKKNKLIFDDNKVLCDTCEENRERNKTSLVLGIIFLAIGIILLGVGVIGAWLIADKVASVFSGWEYVIVWITTMWIELGLIFNISSLWNWSRSYGVEEEE